MVYISEWTSIELKQDVRTTEKMIICLGTPKLSHTLQSFHYPLDLRAPTNALETWKTAEGHTMPSSLIASVLLQSLTDIVS